MLKKLSFENILKADNNWPLFKDLYKNNLSVDTISEVEKMLKCCTNKCGFATFICSHCGNPKIFSFSCKSKLCSRCGKKYVDIWSQSASEMLLNIPHKHIVLTISDKLWRFFINNQSLQKVLLNTAAKVIKEAFSSKQKLTIGFIMVLHPFGDDLEPNFHVHAIVTCGGLSKNNNQFINVNYIDYASIRKIWQYEILSALRNHLSQNKLINPIIDWCFKYRTNGFVVFANTINTYSKKDILSYIARYIRHPPISKRRILNYDGMCVTFSYKSYSKELTKKMPKFEFIKAVLQHVSSKQFKTARRFGLYSRRSTFKYQKTKSLLPPSNIKQTRQFNWRRNLTLFNNKDPLTCPKCGGEMELYKITYIDKSGSFKTICFGERLYTDASPKIVGNTDYG